MDKKTRKEIIDRLTQIATVVYDEIARSGHGVISLQPHMDPRDLKLSPGVYLQPALFMELFGDDTEYEYIQDSYGDLSVVTEVNGVMFHALINSMDLIRNGRLV